MGSRKVYNFNNIVIKSLNASESDMSTPSNRQGLGMLPGIFLFYFFFNSPVVFFFGIISLVIFSIIRKASVVRTDRIRKYLSVMRQKRNWTASEIASYVGVSQDQAIRDLTILFNEGIVKLEPESYAYEYDPSFIKKQNYVNENKFSFNVEKDEKSRKTDKTNSVKKAADNDEKKYEQGLKRPAAGTQNEQLFNQVFEYIKKIRKANDRIPDKQFTQEINEIEKIATQIYEGAMQHPEVMSDMKKFVTYYLPTTLKLLESYADLNERSIVTPTMDETMNNIRSALSDIKAAFYKMYENIFSYTSMDISSEIGALENVLASEGLLNDGLTLKTDEIDKASEEEEVHTGGTN